MRYARSLIFILAILACVGLVTSLNDLQCIFNVGAICPVGTTKILGMQNDSGGIDNAHAQNRTLETYANSICCNNTNPSITISNNCGTSVVKLSSEDNAHLQTGNNTGYSVNVCMNSSSRNLTCSYPTTSCSSREVCVMKLASSEGVDYTNAHLSNCTSSYTQNVCCGYSNSAPVMNTARINPPLYASDGANLTGYCNATDVDEDAQLYNYKWYKNGVVYYQGVAFKNGSISAGNMHSCGIRSSDSRVLCWGNNDYGQLGIGNTTNYTSPVVTTDASPYISISAGGNYVCGIRSSDSRVLCWGNNDYGQLGIGNTTDYSSPVVTTDASPYISISAGGYHSCGIRSNDSRVLCWGYNFRGQLGIGNTTDYSSPVVTVDVSPYISISAGGYHSCGIRSSDSRVLCWGYNVYGRLGTGNTTQYSSPVVTVDVSPYSSISAGNRHSCGIRSNDSRVLCWAYNYDGQLGTANTTQYTIPVETTDSSPYISIMTGESHSCGIRSSDSRVLCWGNNDYGQLGIGNTTDYISPVVTTDASPYISISAGFDHSCGIRASDSRVLCWGNNNKGQLGTGNKTNYTTTVVTIDTSQYNIITTGDKYTCGIRSSDSRVLCWGQNTFGQLGIGNTTEYTIPVETTDASSYISISAGLFHICGIRANDSRVLCWGYNGNGQLGIGNTTQYKIPVVTTDASAYKTLAIGQYHTCGIRSNDSRVLCWGLNAYGGLGTGNFTEYNSPVVTTDGNAYTTISAGQYHTCGIRSNDSRVLCWGWNANGQLGTGNITDYTIPVLITDISAYTNISAGSVYTCGIRASDNRTICWGDNTEGQLGIGINYKIPNEVADNSSYMGRLPQGTEMQVPFVIYAQYTTIGQNWTLSCQAFDTDPLYSSWLNSSNTTIINTYPTRPILTYPLDGNLSVFERYINFTWLASFDQEGDPINYTINVSCGQSCPAKCTPILINLSATNYSSANPLCIDILYNWTVTACDTSSQCNMSNTSTFKIQSVAELIFIVNSTNLGSLSLGQSINTLLNTTTPLVVRNIGNVLMNVTVNATSMFSSVGLNTAYYQFRASFNESNSFNTSCSQVSYTNMASTMKNYLCNMSYVDTNDEARLDFNITVPVSESPGAKTSAILAEGLSAE